MKLSVLLRRPAIAVSVSPAAVAAALPQLWSQTLHQPELDRQLYLLCTVCCYLVWLTWCTVTSTPGQEPGTRDPTEQYFADRGIQVYLYSVILN